LIRSGKQPIIPAYRDPAVILLSQLREVYIDAELETVDTAQWYPKVMRKDWFGPTFHSRHPQCLWQNGIFVSVCYCRS
jgi:hypothetical protein